jgi:hypothetical protein
VLRRTILISAGVVFLLVGAVAASGGSTAGDPYVGTWSVENRPGYDQNTPWKNGGTITVTAASRAQVEAYRNIKGPGQNPSPIQSECLGYPDTSGGPVVSAWYVLSYSWGGTQGTMGGCISDRAGAHPYPLFFGEGTAGQLQAGPSACGPAGTCLVGDWTDKDAPYLTFAASPGSEGTTKTVNAPPPGKSVDVSSPQLPAGGGTISITVSSSNEDDPIGIFGEGDVEALKTYLWIDCWSVLNSPETIKDTGFTPAQRIRRCAAIINEFLKRLGFKVAKKRTPAALAPSRTTAAGGCGAQRLAFRGTLQKKTVSGLHPGKHKLTANSIRYSCTASGGELRLTVQTSRKGGLRKALGKNLDLLIYRPKQAKKGGKLTITYGWK